MSDDKARRVNEDEKDEVEAHGGGKKTNLANEEAKDEAAGDNDVEAHGGGKKTNLANEEAKDESAGDDDFEAHRKPANV
jgi:hypothetical protein